MNVPSVALEGEQYTILFSGSRTNGKRERSWGYGNAFAYTESYSQLDATCTVLELGKVRCQISIEDERVLDFKGIEQLQLDVADPATLADVLSPELIELAQMEPKPVWLGGQNGGPTIFPERPYQGLLFSFGGTASLRVFTMWLIYVLQRKGMLPEEDGQYKLGLELR